MSRMCMTVVLVYSSQTRGGYKDSRGCFDLYCEYLIFKGSVHGISLISEWIKYQEPITK